MAAKARKNDIKTRATGASVTAFLDQVRDDTRRKDCRKLLAIMKKVTGEKARMWGASIVGFGSYHYAYASGPGAHRSVSGGDEGALPRLATVSA